MSSTTSTSSTSNSFSSSQSSSNQCENNRFRSAEKQFSRKKLVVEKKSDEGEKKRKVHKLVSKEELDFFVDVSQSEPLEHVTQLSNVEFKSKALGSSTSTTVGRYQFAKHPGLMLLRNVFTAEQQIALAQLCLTTWSEPPNKSNLTAQHGTLHHLFDKAVQHGDAENNETKLNNQQATKKLTNRQLLEKRRWTTLGYQYDWTARVYDEDDFVAMPPLLCQLSDELVQLADKNAPEYVGEAVIINFYHHDNKLCGHLDDAERFYDAPIVSISLGLECIFLIGGESRTVAPTPILLRSGDCLIMGGASRKCYHGVPRIFKSTFNPNFDNLKLKSIVKSIIQKNDNNNNNNNNDNVAQCVQTQHVLEYLKTNRININVRQANPLDSKLLKRF